MKFQRRVKDEFNTVGLNNLKNRATIDQEEEEDEEKQVCLGNQEFCLGYVTFGTSVSLEKMLSGF